MPLEQIYTSSGLAAVGRRTVPYFQSGTRSGIAAEKLIHDGASNVCTSQADSGHGWWGAANRGSTINVSSEHYVAGSDHSGAAGDGGGHSWCPCLALVSHTCWSLFGLWPVLCWHERNLWPGRCIQVDAMESPVELIAAGVDWRSVLFLDLCTPISDRGYFAI